MKAPFAILALLALLAGCATLNEDQCRAGNWAEIGFADGEDGRLESHLEKHRDACAEFGITPDRAAWLSGRASGLRFYCTPRNAYEVGRRGGSIAPVCSAEARTEMQPAWSHGRAYHRIRQEIDHLRSEKRRLRAELAEVSDPSDPDRHAYLASRLRFIDLDILQLELELSRYDSWPR